MKHNIFSFYLAESPSSESESSSESIESSNTENNNNSNSPKKKQHRKSSFHLGNIDKSNMLSNFTFVNVVSETYWEIDIEDIKIGNFTTNICSELRDATGRCGVAVDSGTSLYAGPTEYYKI